MTSDSLQSLRDAIVAASRSLTQSGIMPISHHGNFSARVPNTDSMLITGGGSLDNLQPEQLALVDLDGKLLQGELTTSNAETVHMHAVVYKHHPEAGAVVHTHSPFATAFAVAGRALACSYEAMVRGGMTEDVPIAHYGPRGSQIAIANIAAAMAGGKEQRAVLLENHGVLAFGPDPQGAARANVVLEEAAQISLYAESLGGAKPIPMEMRKATLERRDQFAREGTQRA